MKDRMESSVKAGEYFVCGILLLLMVVILTSCGINTAGNRTSRRTDDRAATGSALGAEEGEGDLSAYVNCSKNCVYVGTGNYYALDSGLDEEIAKYGSAIFQLTPKGEVLGCFPLEKNKENLCEVCQVTDEWVYAVIYRGGVQMKTTHSALWRIPIRTEGGKEKLEWGKREKLLDFPIPKDEEFRSCIAVTDPYIFYSTDLDTVYCYDRKSGEVTDLRTVLPDRPEGNICVEQMSDGCYDCLASHYRILSVTRQDEDCYSSDEPKYLYVLDCENFQLIALKGICRAGDLVDENVVVGIIADHYLFCTKERGEDGKEECDDIYCLEPDELFSGNSGVRTLVTAKEIGKKLSEINPWNSNNGKKRRFYCTELFYYRTRLYIKVKLFWKAGKKDLSREDLRELESYREDMKLADDYEMSGEIYLSVERDGEHKLRYEKDLSDALEAMHGPYKYSYIGYDEDGKNITVGAINRTLCYGFGFIEGRFFFGLSRHPRAEDTIGCYDIRTGKSSELTKKDADYFLRSYTGEVDFGLQTWFNQAKKKKLIK